jgi:nitrogenase molybdenum-iron protein alpha/beta subunit
MAAVTERSSSLREAPEAREALHLAVSDTCNNSCVFCLNSRVDGRIEGAPVKAPSLEETLDTLRQGYDAGLREAAFTIAEPTVGKHLVAAVRAARDMGYEAISMNTNGRLLHRGRLLEELLEAGLTHLVLSLHGDRAEVHDPLVGRDGAFAQVMKGLELLGEIRQAYPVKMTVLYVLNRANLSSIEPMWRLFLRVGDPDRGDKLAFTALKMMGLASERYDEYGLPYAALVGEWLAVWHRVGAPAEMLLSEVPACVLVSQAVEGRPLPPFDVPDQRFVKERVGPDGADPIAGDVLAGTTYTKREACRGCRLFDACNGVLNDYLERHGWDEFPPATALPAEVAGSSARSDGGPAGTSAEVRPELSGDAARRFTAALLGAPVEALDKAGIAPLEVCLDQARVLVSLAAAGDATLTIELSARDDARPAFLRTAHLDLSYRVEGQEVGRLASGLLKRLTRRLAPAKMELVLRAFEEGRASMEAEAAAGAASALPEPDGDDVAESPFGDAALARSVGDVACGMMGAVDVLTDLSSDLVVLVHGDRGCLPLRDVADKSPVYTSDLGEIDVVSGGEARLMESVDAILAGRPAPEAVVLVSTCLAEMIGEDLGAVARELEARHEIPVVPIKATGLQPLRPVEVANRVQGALAKRFLPAAGEARDEVGLVGYPDHMLRFHREVARHLGEVDVGVGGVWPYDGLEGLKRLMDARFILTPERVTMRALLGRVEKLGGPPVHIQRAPFGLEGTRAFYGEIGRRMDREGALREALASVDGEVAARVAEFRARHEGARVAVSFGSNRKGTSVSNTTHLGLGYVPLLLELGLHPVLIALTDDSDAQRARIDALAARIGIDGGAHVHRNPEMLTDILTQVDVRLAINEDCQKHWVDAAGVPYLHFRDIDPGYQGLLRAVDHLEVILS